MVTEHNCQNEISTLFVSVERILQTNILYIILNV